MWGGETEGMGSGRYDARTVGVRVAGEVVVLVGC